MNAKNVYSCLLDYKTAGNFNRNKEKSKLNFLECAALLPECSEEVRKTGKTYGYYPHEHDKDYKKNHYLYKYKQFN